MKIITRPQPTRVATASLATAALAALLLTVGVGPALAAPSPQLTGTTLTVSHTTIYPTVDGYRDSLGIVVAKRVTGASGNIPLTGTVTITRAGKTIRSFHITTSATETYAWSGHVADKIVAGNYTVAAKVTGSGVTITKRAVVAVSHKKLVSRTSVATVSAQDFFQNGYSSVVGHSGCVPTAGGTISCTSAKGVPAVGANYVPAPARVLRFSGYRQYSARVAVTVSHTSVVTGTDNYWEWDGAHRRTITSAGTQTTGTSFFGASQGSQLVEFRVGGGSSVRFDQVSITYGYWFLA